MILKSENVIALAIVDAAAGGGAAHISCHLACAQE